MKAGLGKVLSSHLGQEGFPVSQVTFHFQLCIMVKGPGKSSIIIKSQKDYTETCSGHQTFENCLSKGLAGIKIVFQTLEMCIFFFLSQGGCKA